MVTSKESAQRRSSIAKNYLIILHAVSMIIERYGLNQLIFYIKSQLNLYFICFLKISV